MNDETTATTGIGLKLVAIVALLVGAWILLKVVIGVLTTIAWVVVIVGAIFAVFWALSILRR